jgi:hypothetical protein
MTRSTDTNRLYFKTNRHQKGDALERIGLNQVLLLLQRAPVNIDRFGNINIL